MVGWRRTGGRRWASASRTPTGRGRAVAIARLPIVRLSPHRAWADGLLPLGRRWSLRGGGGASHRGQATRTPRAIAQLTISGGSIKPAKRNEKTRAVARARSLRARLTGAEQGLAG